MQFRQPPPIALSIADFEQDAPGYPSYATPNVVGFVIPASTNNYRIKIMPGATLP
jgi:hypothetical protein